MLRSNMKGGWTDLAGLVVVAGLGVFFVFLLTNIPLIHGIIGTNTNVYIVVDIDKQGTMLNSFLQNERDGKEYWEVLGDMKAGGSGSVELEQTVEKLGMSILVKDGDDVLFSEGDVSETVIDFALPGLRKGKIGVKHERI